MEKVNSVKPFTEKRQMEGILGDVDEVMEITRGGCETGA